MSNINIGIKQFTHIILRDDISFKHIGLKYLVDRFTPYFCIHSICFGCSNSSLTGSFSNFFEFGKYLNTLHLFASLSTKMIMQGSHGSETKKCQR